MSEGIVVKVWNVTANKGERSGASQMSSSINYIENPEKVAVRLDDSSIIQMSNELNYVMNDLKTMQGLYIGGRRISDFYNATNEMLQIKQFFGKLDGRVALHGIVSLPESESHEKNAGKLMLLLDEVMAEIFPENQVVYAVHTNTSNMHIHFIINTVGMDGKKIHMDNTFVKQVLQPIVNDKAKKYGFTPNDIWSKEYKNETIPLKKRKIIICKMIDEAIEQTDDFSDFIAYLRKDGARVNVGKNISIQLDGMAKPIRTGRLGEDYTFSGICRRIGTKLDPIVWKEVGEHAHYISEKELLFFTPDKIKKYKDMSIEEQRKAIRLIKLKRNPWEEVREKNWLLQRMSKELNETGFVYELVHYYSGGKDNVSMALEEITNKRKALVAETNDIKENLKNNRGVVAIYDEMQKYMHKAYLYDVAGRTEFIDDYKAYMNLVKRLEVVYEKNASDVGEFVTDQRNQLMYAKAQDKELKNHYSIIKKYIDKGSFRVNEEGLSFFKAVGHSEAKRNAKDYGIYKSDIKFIVGKTQSDIVARVITRPDVIDGKNTITTVISIIDKNSNILKEISSTDMDARAFNEAIFELAKEYGMKECQTHRKNIQRNL